MSHSETSMLWPDVLAAIAAGVSSIAAIISVYFAIRSRRFSDRSLFISEEQLRLSQGQQWHQYINEACAAFSTRGTPFHYIDTIPGLTDVHKEIIWSHAFLRFKGKPPAGTFAEERKHLESLEKEKQPWIAEAGAVFKCRTRNHWNRLWQPGDEFTAKGGEEVPYHFDLVSGRAIRKQPEKPNT